MTALRPDRSSPTAKRLSESFPIEEPEMAPLFSIVTITYQNLHGLEETVESVRRQTFRDFEHIVVDGGSTDGTREWLEQEFDGHWVSERDRGRYHGMNKGADMASGEYLWFLHAGDAFRDCSVLVRVAEAVASRPEWVYGLARVVDPDKRLLGTLGFAPFSMFNFAILNHALPHQATVIRRDLFQRLGGYDENVPVAADQLFMLRAAMIAPPVAMADFLCDFDSTGVSAGRSWWTDYREAEKNRRQMEHPITRWRTLDTVLSFGYALARQVARAGRAAVTS
jgi:glycosyltransferase involved in cell wall biosynthesis